MSDASTPTFADADPASDTLPHPPTPAVSAHPNPPRRGDLTFGWRVATAGIWIGVIVGLAAVWNASVQLGLSTWWLGPRAAPQPRVVQFVPFVAPVLMLLATINQVRWLAWLGLAAAAGVAAVGLGDLGRVNGLAIVELTIAGAAALASVASLTGTFRAASPVETPTPSVATD